MRVRIWLASAIVIILILLLALTVNHAREKDMVEIFGRRQLVHARNTAGRIADVFSQAEKNIAVFSRFDSPGKTSEKEIDRDFKIIFSGWENSVNAVVLFDAEGKVKRVFPGGATPAVDLSGHFDVLKKNRKQHLELSLAEKEVATGFGQSRDWYLIIGNPIRYQGNDFAGAWLASFSLGAIIGTYEKQTRESNLGYLWLADAQGKIIVHPAANLIGKNIRDLLPGGKDIPLNFAAGRGNYLETAVQYNTGHGERSIVAYSPLQTGDKTWIVFIAAPYDQVISPVRTTFIYTLFTALLLIIVVVIASISFAYREGKRLRIKEERKRLAEREAWQEKLLREKKTIEGIIEGSPIPKFVIDKGHKVILWNSACEELTGCSADEMIGTDKSYKPFYSSKRPLIADLIVDRDFEGLDKYYGAKKVKKSDKILDAYEATDYFENLGGHSRYLYFLAAPIYDEKGEIIAAIETLQDISREKELTRSLRENAESLQNELFQNIDLQREIQKLNSYLQSIVRSLPDKIFVLDENGFVHYISRGLEDEISLYPSESSGRYFLDFVAPADRDFILARWEEAKNGIYKPYEIEAVAKDGRKLNLLVTTSPVVGTSRYVVVQRDITEFKDMEKKLFESRKMAALGQLSAGIAHEVRNPLSSIKMSLQILEKRMSPAGNDLKRFKIAEKEVEHLEELVNNVLIFAKPVEPKKTSTDLVKILEQALAMTEKGIADKHVKVRTKYEKVPPVLADAAMMVDAFVNIIRNAVEAVEENGTIDIFLDLPEGGGNHVVVRIKDNGNGIDAADMPHLFNPFFTRKKYGTGLGLSQVKKIIEIHQGTIDIESEKGRGTTVKVILPCADRRKSPRLVQDM
ncbi:MAG: Sporulation kinase A [Smithella sp. PtaU1.Bin162]|nr:MAG: Sporulation kinase A [Smithella sp. PtaU1.Bin162]